MIWITFWPFGPFKNFKAPVVCKIWEEDGVCNCAAEHLPVAVFGPSFGEALQNLLDALHSHFETLDELDADKKERK